MKFWNYKFVGIFGAIMQLLPSLWIRIKDEIYTISLSSNLGYCEKNVTIQSSTTIRYPKQISVSENVYIGRYVTLNSELSTSKLWIGKNTQISLKSSIDFSGDLKIGNFCTISANVKIITHDHGYDPKSKPNPRPLVIENNVWIGADSTILHNVDHIGENSIIAACSVVTKSIPKNVVVAGNPAKIIKYL